MALSKQSIEMLLDLVEIKLGNMEIYDREDARERMRLEVCRRELLVWSQNISPRTSSSVISL